MTNNLLAESKCQVWTGLGSTKYSKRKRSWTGSLQYLVSQWKTAKISASLLIKFFRREQCGLRRFQSFVDMTDVINVETVDRLSQIYTHVDDIDLFSGGLAERPVVGGVVGPTFACIIGKTDCLIYE